MPGMARAWPAYADRAFRVGPCAHGSSLIAAIASGRFTARPRDLSRLISGAGWP
jgi:hypothetical protein